MAGEQFLQFESNFFGALNRFAEPLVRAGLGNPILWPTGTIVLEVSGRNTGRRYNVPLVATRVGNMFVVSTVRRRSQWLKNVAAVGAVRYWIGGRAREANAFVIASGGDAPADLLPQSARCLARALSAQSRMFGVGFAILVPNKPEKKAV